MGPNIFDQIFFDADDGGAGAGAGDGDGDGAPEDDDGEGVKEGQTVSYKRFKAVIDQKNHWKGQASSLGEQASQLEQLQTQYDTDKAIWEQERSSWGEERTLVAAGIKPDKLDEGAVVARAVYNNLPEGDRPEFGAWVEGWGADGAEAPAGVRAYLAAPAASGGAGAAGAGDSKGAAGGAGAGEDKGKVNPDDGRGPDGGPPKAVTAASLRAAREEALVTGDWSKWQALDKAATEARARDRLRR